MIRRLFIRIQRSRVSFILIDVEEKRSTSGRRGPQLAKRLAADMDIPGESTSGHSGYFTKDRNSRSMLQEMETESPLINLAEQQALSRTKGTGLFRGTAKEAPSMWKKRNLCNREREPAETAEQEREEGEFVVHTSFSLRGMMAKMRKYLWLEKKKEKKEMPTMPLI